MAREDRNDRDRDHDRGRERGAASREAARNGLSSEKARELSDYESALEARDRRSRNLEGSGSQRQRVAISADPDSFEQYGLVDDVDVRVLDAWFSPWVMKGKDQSYPPVTALWIKYLNLDDDEEFVDQISLGRTSSKFYAPGASDFEDDFAGGYSKRDYQRVAEGEMEVEEDMRGGFLLPLSSRKSGSRSSNYDFYLSSLKSSAKANEVPIQWTTTEGYARDIGEILAGLEGKVNRLKNDLIKGTFADDEGKAAKERKVLVFTVVYGRSEVKSSGARSSHARDTEPEGKSESRSRSRDRDQDNEPKRESRSRDRDQATIEKVAEEQEAPRKPASGKSKSNGLDTATRKLLESLVLEKLEKAKGGKMARTRLVSIVGHEDLETDQDNDLALEVVTKDEYIDSFWAASRKWDYDADSDEVRLAD